MAAVAAARAKPAAATAPAVPAMGGAPAGAASEAADVARDAPTGAMRVPAGQVAHVMLSHNTAADAAWLLEDGRASCRLMMAAPILIEGACGRERIKLCVARLLLKHLLAA